MLKLRRGVAVGADPLVVEVAGERRRAWADAGTIGEVREGDELIVNVEALDLELGSGGFDVVHANLTRGLAADGAGGAHVMKLNYTPLQHAVDPVELAEAAPRAAGRWAEGRAAAPVLVLPLHGHLAPAAWAADRARPGIRLGFVQTAGGALPGALSEDVRDLRSRGLLSAHVTAGPAYGGEAEALGVLGAIDAAARGLGWEAVLVGPGPGIIGSGTAYGHGGMAALESAHAALALGLETLLSPRLSGGDERPRHRGLSHHTASVLELLLAPVRVPVPEIDATSWPVPESHAEPGAEIGALDELRSACGDLHDLTVEPVDLPAYRASGLPTRTMGRELAEDPLFFAAALAAGGALGRASEGGEPG